MRLSLKYTNVIIKVINLKLKISSKLFNPKNIVFFLMILFLLPVFILLPVVTVKAQAVTDIPVQTAYDMINNKTQYPDLIILDVREPSEYDVSHICNATLIPLGQIDARISELEPYKDTEIIVYCRTDARSGVASDNLVNNHNFTKIFNMEGGISAWIAAGYPICSDGQGQPIIDFNLISFSLILFSTIILITALYKKKISKSRNFYYFKKKKVFIGKLNYHFIPSIL